jgi:Tol biopolymer transport system component
VFTGNGGAGSYRLYRARLDGKRAPELLLRRSTEDGHPAVSPDGRWLAYVSARAGVGKLLLRNLQTGEERPLTQGAHVDLHPVWSPDSRSIAFTSGANDNHDVFLVPDVLGPPGPPVPLTRWSFDDLRPTFSPDGTHVAFYSNFSPVGEEDEWSILVVPADGSGPTKGMDLAGRVVATNVVKDSAVGPAWLPRGLALAFARDLKEEWNPIYVVDVHTRQERRIETDTRMNHDLACSKRGLLAFRAQVGSWDDIFVAQLLRVQ